MPKVSVIIPTYNCAKFICVAIESVLNQSFCDFELIVVDDGSIDDTKQIVEKYQRLSNKVKYFYQTNKGISAARNKGIAESMGQFITFLDSDDAAGRDCLKLLLQGFENDTIYITTGKILPFTPYTLIQSILALRHEDDSCLSGKEYRNTFPITNTMVRKTIFKDVGNFDENMRNGEDDDFINRVKLSTLKIMYVPEANVFYRYRENFKELMRQKYYYGFGKIYLYIKYPQLRKNILQDFCDLVIDFIILSIRSIARILKFIFFRKYRRLIMLLEHPLGMACVGSNHLGRLRIRLKNCVWF